MVIFQAVSGTVMRYCTNVSDGREDRDKTIHKNTRRKLLRGKTKLQGGFVVCSGGQRKIKTRVQ